MRWRWDVTVVDDKEARKANMDACYAPKERVVDTIEADNELQALGIMHRRVRKGWYHPSATLVEQR